MAEHLAPIRVPRETTGAAHVKWRRWHRARRLGSAKVPGGTSCPVGASNRKPAGGTANRAALMRSHP